MNEKVAKKIGEAHAFAHVLRDTYQSYESVMSELLGTYADSALETTNDQVSKLTTIAEEAGTTGIVLPKAERTITKITKMAEMYVGDEWDNPVEVLEWMSFFVGGAIVHWQLIAASGDAMDNEALAKLATEGANYYSDLMEQLRSYAVTIGRARAEG